MGKLVFRNQVTTNIIISTEMVSDHLAGSSLPLSVENGPAQNGELGCEGTANGTAYLPEWH